MVRFCPDRNDRRKVSFYRIQLNLGQTAFNDCIATIWPDSKPKALYIITVFPCIILLRKELVTDTSIPFCESSKSVSNTTLSVRMQTDCWVDKTTCHMHVVSTKREKKLNEDLWISLEDKHARTLIPKMFKIILSSTMKWMLFFSRCVLRLCFSYFVSRVVPNKYVSTNRNTNKYYFFYWK